MLERWWNNVTTFITREDAIGAQCATVAITTHSCNHTSPTAMAGDDPQAVKWYARVYDFLLEHGHINFGLCAPSAPDNGTKDTAGKHHLHLCVCTVGLCLRLLPYALRALELLSHPSLAFNTLPSDTQPALPTMLWCRLPGTSCSRLTQPPPLAAKSRLR